MFFFSIIINSNFNLISQTTTLHCTDYYYYYFYDVYLFLRELHGVYRYLQYSTTEYFTRWQIILLTI